ncbi:unnamed protein product [Closterium sp. NIES-65]|nr:unnamed protein product [Closterium sp. NIES-65]
MEEPPANGRDMYDIILEQFDIEIEPEEGPTINDNAAIQEDNWYSSRDHCLFALLDDAVVHKYGFYMKSTRRASALALCKSQKLGLDPPCPWRCSYARLERNGPWRIVELSDPAEHTCDRVYRTRWWPGMGRKRKYLWRKFGNFVRAAPFNAPWDYARQITACSGPKLTYNNASRLKVGITAQRFGDWCESFRYIPAVQERIRQIDSGATVELLTYNHEFLRFFMAPSATREALKTCRPVIALDGTFLNRAQKATLLYANAMDGNQQIIPIAWALVDSETKDTWTWFCRLFDKHCSDWKGRDDAAIISDRDKGLIPAVKEVFPEKVAHYFCGWHMQQNVKRFGKTSADMIWRLLTARSLDKYNELKVGARESHPLLTTYLYANTPDACDRQQHCGQSG